MLQQDLMPGLLFDEKRLTAEFVSIISQKIDCISQDGK